MKAQNNPSFIKKDFQDIHLDKNSKNVLIVSYIFPPVPGIGGRRWAKFAKNLKKNGVNVFVIAFKSEYEEPSTWTNDVEGIEVYWLKSNYPKILEKQPKGFIQKLYYRFQLIRVKISIRGNYYDRVSLDEENLEKKIKEIVEDKGINTVIASGFPFNLTFFISKLKESLTIKVISDFRDPWAWKESYGLNTMSYKRLLEERKKEEFVMLNSDFITVPDKTMADELNKLYPLHNKKIINLHHGYDFEKIQGNRSKKNVKSKIICYGSMYSTIEKEISNLAYIFQKMEINYQMDFYCYTKNYIDIFEKYDLLEKKVFYHNPLIESDLYKIMTEYDYYLFVYPDYKKDYIVTKIHEIIFSRLPIICVGEKGILSEFIVENRLGFFVEKDKIIEKIPLILEGKVHLDYNYEFDTKEYSLETISKKLIDII